MSADIFTTVATASGAVVVAGASYWFTKKRERDAELRKEKLEHYKEFVACLSGVVSGEFTPQSQRAFALACNKLNLVAPQSVITALQRFQNEIKVSNSSKSLERHDQLMSELFFEMRKDLQITPSDNLGTFSVGLWSSGQPAS